LPCEVIAIDTIKHRNVMSDFTSMYQGNILTYNKQLNYTYTISKTMITY